MEYCQCIFLSKAFREYYDSEELLINEYAKKDQSISVLDAKGPGHIIHPLSDDVLAGYF